MSEKELDEVVKGVRRGDQESFGKFYKAFEKYVYYICYRYTGSKVDSEDLAQNAFILIFEKIHTLRKQESILSWMGKIVATAYERDREYKSSKKRQAEIHQEDISGMYDLYEEDAQLPDDVLLEKEEKEKISALIDTLPLKQKRMVFLFYYQGFTAKEISQFEGCSEESVRNSLFKARNNLKKGIEEGLKKENLGGLVVIAFQNEFEGFGNYEESMDNVWQELSQRIPDLAKAIVKKGPLFYTGIVGLLALSIGTGIFVNYSEVAVLPIEISQEFFQPIREVKMVSKEIIRDDNGNISEVPAVEGDVVVAPPAIEYIEVMDYIEGGAETVGKDTAQVKPKLPLLTIYDFLSYQDANYIIGLGSTPITEADWACLWNVLNNNGLYITDSRFYADYRYLYKAEKDNSILYVGISRDKVSGFIYATHVVRDIDDVLLEYSLLDEMW